MVPPGATHIYVGGQNAADAGQMLARGGKSEPDALTLFVTRVPAEDRGFDSEA